MIQLLEAVKAYLKITSSTHDSLLEDFLEFAQSEVESYCRQPILVRGMYLSNLMIIKTAIIIPYTVPVTIIKVEYKDSISGDYIEVSPNDYEIYMETVMKINILHAKTITNYIWRITASVGYTFEQIPKEILKVIIEMVAKQFKNSVQGKDDLGKSTISTSQSGTTANTSFIDLYPQWYRLINKYKILTF